MTETRAWTLPLNYEKPPLSLNKRMHWTVRAEWTRTLRAEAFTRAHIARLPKGLDSIHVTLHWRPGDKRRRDTDNMTATLKPLIDGLRDYGLIPDDDSTHATSECVIEEPGERVRMWLTITGTESPGAWYARTGHCHDCGQPGNFCLCRTPCACADLHLVGSGLGRDAADAFAAPVEVPDTQDVMFGVEQ